MTKISFPDSMEIDENVTPPNAEPSMNMTIDSRDEYDSADDSIRVKSEFDSNEIDESDSQFEKHFEPRISTFLGIKID
jgi:hypothetical protein